MNLVTNIFIRIIVLHGFLFWCSLADSAVLVDSLIKTAHGFTLAENIKCDDELISYSDDKKIKTCIVQKVAVVTTNTVIEIATEKGIIQAAPEQLFYDPVIKGWVVAQNITTSNYLLNSQLQHVKCIDVRIVSIAPTKMHQISTTAPHTFFVTDQEVLTHNFFPIVLGVSWLFGLGSIEFAGFNIAAIIAGTAIGLRLCKSKKHKHKHNKSKIVVTPYLQNVGGGTPDPNDDDDPNKKNRKFNNVSKTEFFKSVQDQYEHWKKGIYRRKQGAKGIENAEYLKWDHLHGDVEAYSKSEIPLGSIDPKTLKIYKVVSKFRKML